MRALNPDLASRIAYPECGGGNHAFDEKTKSEYTPKKANYVGV
jgi:hypothetical protein